MDMSNASPWDWAAVVVLTSFMPLTAVTFLEYRLPRKAEEYEKILGMLGFRGENGPAYVPSVQNEYKRLDYVLPVFFATTVTFLGAMTLLVAPKLAGYPNVSLILQGPAIASMKVPDAIKLYGMLVIGLAFIGAYLWSVQNLFRRLTILDLPPTAYYSIGIRILFSIFVALMVYYFSMTDNGETVASPRVLAVLVFLCGMFPQRGLQYLEELIRFRPETSGKKAHPLSLAMIEGIELFERVRLNEISIDNAQNLAQANMVELILRTPFNPRRIIDWIGQARLFLFFTEEIDTLRKAGVRTIFDLKDLGGNAETLALVERQTHIAMDKLTIVNTVIQQDPDIQQLEESVRKLLGFPDRQIAVPN